MGFLPVITGLPNGSLRRQNDMLHEVPYCVAGPLSSPSPRSLEPGLEAKMSWELSGEGKGAVKTSREDAFLSVRCRGISEEKKTGRHHIMATKFSYSCLISVVSDSPLTHFRCPALSPSSVVPPRRCSAELNTNESDRLYVVFLIPTISQTSLNKCGL